MIVESRHDTGARVVPRTENATQQNKNKDACGAISQKKTLND